VRLFSITLSRDDREASTGRPMRFSFLSQRHAEPIISSVFVSRDHQREGAIMFNAPMTGRKRRMARNMTTPTALVLLLGLAACRQPLLSCPTGCRRRADRRRDRSGDRRDCPGRTRGCDRCRRRWCVRRHHRYSDNASAASPLRLAAQDRSCTPALRQRVSSVEAFSSDAQDIEVGEAWTLRGRQAPAETTA